MASNSPHDPVLPERLLRPQSLYRTAPGINVGAGFMLKPTPQGGYADRVMSSYVVVYVLRGTGHYIDPSGARHAVQAGDAIQMTAGRSHGVRQHPDGQWAEAFLVIGEPGEQALTALKAIDPGRPILRPGVDLSIADLFDRLVDELKTSPDDRLPLLTCRIHEILAHLHVQDRRQQDRGPHLAMIDEACRRIGDRPERKPHLADLLADNGLSYERFRKVFRALTGQSPNDYRIRRRIDAARAMLSQDRMGVKQVAYALGYPDPFAFSRQFKQVVGVSPQRFASVGR